MSRDAAARIAGLEIWRSKVDPEPLPGGMTNRNFKVLDQGRSYFVRLGEDVPVHGIVRFAEHAASRAASACGISPSVVLSGPGILVLDFIDGRTLEAQDIRSRATQARLVPLLRRCHRDLVHHLRGPALAFWVFHVIRDYAHTLAAAGHRLSGQLGKWTRAAGRLEARVGRIDLVFGHNDLLAANFIDDGQRLWLVDWDYAGFNSPLFDLGGLASNSELDEADRHFLLEAYFERPVDDALRLESQAMLAASLLREAMWSMVSELHSKVEMDFVAYTTANLKRFAAAFATFEAMERAMGQA